MAVDTKILEVVLDLRDKLSPGLDKTKKKAGQALKDIGGNISDLGSSMGMLAIPIAAIGAGIIKVSADFQASMNNVQALTSATGEEFQKLRFQARELGKSTIFSASQAADGMTFLAQAGFEVNEIYDAMPATLDLAAAAGLGLAQAADISSNILQGFKLEATDMAFAADVLSNTFASSNVNLVQLSESMKFVAPIAAELGLEISEVAAAIGFMGDAGIQGSMAGTAFRMGLLQLASDSGGAADMLKSLGVEIANEAGEMRTLADIIGQLNEKTKDMTDIQRTNTIEAIVGTRAVTAFLTLMSRGQEELEAFAKANEDALGRTGELAEAKLKGFSGALKKFRSAAEGLGITLGGEEGEGFLGSLTPLIDKLTKLTLALDDLAQASPGATSVLISLGATTVILAGFTAALGFVITNVAKFVIAIRSLLGLSPVLVTVGAFLRTTLMTFWGIVKTPVGRAWQAVLVGAAGIATGGLITWIMRPELRGEISEAIFDLFTPDFGEDMAVFWLGVWDDIAEGVLGIWEGMFVSIAKATTKGGDDVLAIAKGFQIAVETIFRDMLFIIVGGSIYPEMWDALVDETDLGAQTIEQRLETMAGRIAQTFGTLADTVLALAPLSKMVFLTDPGGAQPGRLETLVGKENLFPSEQNIFDTIRENNTKLFGEPGGIGCLLDGT